MLLLLKDASENFEKEMSMSDDTAPEETAAKGSPADADAPTENLYYAAEHYWDRDEEEYFTGEPIIWNGEELEFATYAAFLEFMESLSQEEKVGLGHWIIHHTHYDESLWITDGIFDDVSFLSLAAARNEK